MSASSGKPTPEEVADGLFEDWCPHETIDRIWQQRCHRCVLAALRSAVEAERERHEHRIQALEDALRETLCLTVKIVDGRCMNCGLRSCAERRELLGEPYAKSKETP